MNAWLDADWPAPRGVRALITLRHGLGSSLAPFDAFNLGLRCGDETLTVLENRNQLETALQLPSPPRWLRQMHGICAARFDEPPVGAALAAMRMFRKERSRPGPLLQDEPDADAAITRTNGTVLAILTADCLPVVFSAKDGSEIAAAHAGWRGLCAGVLEATVAAMHTPANNIIAWLGPCAGPQAYEVGQEVFDAFVSRDAGASQAFVATRPGHWRVDLYALARQRLADARIAANSIHGGGLCTISEPSRFFSHRRDQRSGRMATLVWRDDT